MKQDLNTVAVNIDELCSGNQVGLSKATIGSARINSITSQAELDLIAGGAPRWGQVHIQGWLRAEF